MDETCTSDRVVDAAEQNAAIIEAELSWFMALLDARLQAYFHQGEELLHFRFDAFPPPALAQSNTRYAQLVLEQGLVAEERLLLVLALIPSICPQLLDVLFSKNPNTDRGYSEFGGLQGQVHSGFIPTVETALFIIAGDNIFQRFKTMRFIETGSALLASGIVQCINHNPHEPWTTNGLFIAKDVVDSLTSGQDYKPGYSQEFPARRITTNLDWHHLVLPTTVMEQLEEIKHWVKHGEALMQDWGMAGKLSPGFTTLFYGPPGTGKTLSSCLLGNYCQRDVYKIDLSLMVSKYIGETEKNLARIFDTAQSRNWILFFDEADALFGKRTKVDDSHDRYANQEVSYLLQRIEDFDGVVILATNFKSNIDDAFIRRFQSVIQFPLPSVAERIKIWQKAFSSKVELAEDVNLIAIAEKYDISGGTIMNVVRFSSLRALSRDSKTIIKDDIEEGVRREFIKEGKRI